MKYGIYGVLIFSIFLVLLFPGKKEEIIIEEKEQTVVDLSFVGFGFVEPKVSKLLEDKIDDYQYHIVSINVTEGDVLQKGHLIMSLICEKDMEVEAELHYKTLETLILKKERIDLEVLNLQKESYRVRNELESLNLNYISQRIKKDELDLSLAKLKEEIAYKEKERMEVDILARQLSYEFEELSRKCSSKNIRAEFESTVKEITANYVLIDSNEKQIQVSLTEGKFSRIKKYQEVELNLENGPLKGVKFRSYINAIRVDSKNAGKFIVEIPVPSSFQEGFRVHVRFNEEFEVINPQSATNEMDEKKKSK